MDIIDPTDRRSTRHEAGSAGGVDVEIKVK